MNTRCRIRVMALLLAVALMALPVWADGVDKADIADPYLLKAVESSQQEADAVKSLEVHHVSTLEGIEVLQALEELALYEVGDLDLSPLVRLPNLRALVIYADEPLSCPEVVGKLTSLRELTMDNCGLVDLTFLTPLQNLHTLSLSQNRITDVAPLASLHGLGYLSLFGNRISDLGPLASLKGLEYLLLSDNPIRDITPLAELKNLKKLWLNETLVEDLTPLAGLDQLTELYLSFSRVKDVSPLEGLPLKRLRIWGLEPEGLHLLPEEVEVEDMMMLRGEASFEDYTVRMWTEIAVGFFEILKGDEQVYSEYGFIGFDIADMEGPEGLQPAFGSDINGNGTPDVAIIQRSGGAHGGGTLYVIELGSEPKKLAEITFGDGVCYFADVAAAPGLELILQDNYWVYWRVSRSFSPMPTVVFTLENGEWKLCDEAMLKPAPNAYETLEILRRVRRGIEAGGIADEDSKAFWGELLELMYSGHADLAWQILDLAWPENVPGKEEFTESFIEHLQERKWPDFASLNGGKLIPEWVAQ